MFFTLNNKARGHHIQMGCLHSGEGGALWSGIFVFYSRGLEAKVKALFNLHCMALPVCNFLFF